MNDVVKIARNEWVILQRNRVAVVLLLVFTSLLLIAAYVGIDSTLQQNSFRRDYQDIVKTQWMDQPDRHPHRVAHYGYLAFREKSLLSFFDFGIETFVGNAVFLEAHRQNTINLSEAGFSNGILRFGELSMALILQLLVPLFIFFVGYDTVAGLKQNGMLKVILSQGVSMRTLLWGKMLGIFSYIFLFFLFVMLAGFAANAIIMRHLFDWDLIVRIFLLLLLYAVYFAACTWAAVMVSAFSKKPGNALVALIVIWMLCGVILPKVSQTVGTGIYPSVSKLEFEKEIEEDLSKVGDSHNPDDQHFAAFRAETLKKYNVETVDDLPINYSGYVMAEGERITSTLFNKHFDSLIASYKNQNSVANYLSFINPYLMVRNLSMTLSGTDMEHYIDFQKQAETFRYNQAQWLNEIHTNEIQRVNDKAQRVSNSYFKNQEVFHYQKLKIAPAIENQIIPALACLAWLLLMAASVGYLSKQVSAL